MSTFFFDIDGTLAFQGEIAKGNVEALKELRRKGHLLFICTGRQQSYASDLFDAYVDGYIANNGRYITFQNKCLFHNPLDVELIREVDEMVVALGGMCVFTGEHYSYIKTLVPHLVPLLNKQGGKEVQDTWTSEPLYSFSICYQEPLCVKDFQEVFEDRIILNDHHNGCTADASTKGFDKGDGIAYVINALHLDPKETYAFGDGSNDLCMFANCAHTIAMGNAIDALKEKAEMISSHFQEGGIVNALKAYQIL